MKIVVIGGTGLIGSKTDAILCRGGRNRHAVNANASETEPAKLMAAFVVDTNESVLTTPFGS